LGVALALLGGMLTPAFAAGTAVLSMTSSVAPSPLTVGGTAVYTVTVQDTGTADAANVTTILPFNPAGTLTIGAPLPAACTSSAQTVTCTEATIPAGGSVTYTVPVTLLPSGSNGENIALQGVATATGVQAATTNLIVPAFTQADVEIVKTGPATGTPGGSIAYTITVTNHGPSDAQGVTWYDQTNGNLTTITSYPCGNTGLTVTCNLGTLAAGATRTFTLPETVNPGVAAGTVIPNCASVSTGTNDTDTANNQSCINTTVGIVPPPTTSNITIVKSAPATVLEGGTIPYSVTITNTGPDPATSVVITGQLGTDLASASALPPACTVQGTAVVCQIATLAVGESRTYTYSATLAPSATAGTNVVSCTSATSANGVSALSAPQACAQTLVLPVPTADVSIVKDGPAQALAGGTYSYTLKVTNSGPDDAANLVVTDPTGTFPVTVTSVPAGCQVTAGTVSCNAGTLAAGTSATFTVTLQVNAGAAPGTVIHNCGTATSSTQDPNIPNNTSCADTYVNPPVPVTDVDLAKTGPVTAYPGDTISYTLSAANQGPDTATDVVLTDALDPNLTVASLPSGCTASAGTVTCTIGTLAVGPPASFTFTATVGAGVAAGTTIQNCASAASVSTVLTPTPEPGCAQTVIVPPPADIAIGATGPATAVPGATLSYTLIAINNGPGDAPNATVTVPVDLTLVTITALPPNCADTGGRLICLADTLAPGASQAFPVTVRLNPGVQGVALPNCAQVTTTAQDPNLSNNQLCGAINVALPSPPKATIEVVKHGPVAAYAGGTIRYSVTVTNHGPDAVSDLSVTDPLAGSLAGPLASVSLPGNCFLNAGIVTCVAGALAVGQAKTFTYSVRVGAGAAPGTLISNCAAAVSIIATLTLNAKAGCTAAAVLPTPPASLVISKTAPRATGPGTLLDYQVTVTNYGSSAAYNVRVKDPIQGMPQVTIASLPRGCALAGHVVTCALGTIPAGAARSLTIRVRAGDVAGTDTVLRNCGNVYSSTYSLNLEHAQACATTIVRGPFIPVTG
jgi:uncharacterized repeat protein (TIGR01451 family)